MNESRLLALTTVMALIFYPLFAIYGVIELTEGDTVPGIVLLASPVIGVYCLIQWRRSFANRNARPS